MRALILCGVLALGGCATTGTVTGASPGVTQTQSDAARATYDAVFLAPAAHYRSLGLCAAGQSASVAKPCASPAIVAKLVSTDKAVAKGFATVQALVSSGQGAAALSALSSLEGVITTASGLAAKLGIGS